MPGCSLATYPGIIADPNMSDEAKVQNSKLTKEHKRLINDSLTTHIVRFQEYRLNSDREPEINPETGKPKK